MMFLILVGALGATQQATDLSGKPVDPLEASRGHVTVLIFVRTDCPLSNRYAPIIQQLSAQDSSARFWLVYPAKTDTVALIQQNLREYGYHLSALRDTGHALVKLGQIKVTPEAAVFDSHGTLVYHGAIDNWYSDFGRSRPAPTVHTLADAVSAAMNGRAPSVSYSRAVGCFVADLE